MSFASYEFKGKIVGLLIGVNNYNECQHFSNLECAEKDALAFFNVLFTNHLFNR